jgi:hypothetical protein
MHRYTIELRIVGKNLSAEAITRTLGLEPTQVRRMGEPKVEGATSKWTANVWGFEVLPPGKDDWSSLENGIETLLRTFGPVREQLRACSVGNEVYVWCGHFTSSFDGGPTLSPTLLKSLGDFGIQLVLDTYSERTGEVPNRSEELPARG